MDEGQVPILPIGLAFFVIIFLGALLIILVVWIQQCIRQRAQKAAKRILPKRVNVLPPSLPPTSRRNKGLSDNELDVSIKSGDDDIVSLESRPSSSATSEVDRPLTAFRRRDGRTRIALEVKSNDVASNITLGERLKTLPAFVLYQGCFDDSLVNVYVTKPSKSSAIIEAKMINFVRWIPHPRFVRFLGTLLDGSGLMKNLVTDFVAGATLEELGDQEDLRQVLGLTEPEKLQVAADVADGLYFLHNLSTPVVHGDICPANIIIDGETHRGKLLAKEIRQGLLQQSTKVVEKQKSDPSRLVQAPELVLPALYESEKDLPLPSSDVWSFSSCILELLLEQRTWGALDSSLSMEQAMMLGMEPSILSHLMGANFRLQFIAEGLRYDPKKRPPIASLSKNLDKCVKAAQEYYDKWRESFIFPGRPLRNLEPKVPIDPLTKQQIEWNVRQERDKKRRALMFANVSYPRKSLSITPINDVKDVSNLLSEDIYGTENTYENVASFHKMEEIVVSYIEALNKNQEEIDLLLIYYSGLLVQSRPRLLDLKLRKGLMLDRTALHYDLALVMSDNSLYPLARLQINLAKLHGLVRRKLVIIDGRLLQDPERQIEVPVLPEPCVDRLSTLFTLYPRTDVANKVVEMDSHPSRTNGFLSGCLVDVLTKQGSINVDSLPMLVNNEMRTKARRTKAFQGIHCQGDTEDTDLWNESSFMFP